MASYAGELSAHLAAALSALAPSLVHPSPSSSTADLAAHARHARASQDDIDDREHALRQVLARLRPSSSAASGAAPSSAPARTLSPADLAQLVDDTFPPFQGNAAIPLSPQTETVELVTLAQLAVQAYGTVLRTLIDQATQLDDHDEYWARLESDAWSAALYLVQTTPSRAVSLGVVTITRLRKLTTSSLRTAADPAERPSLLQLNTWRRALPPSLFLTSVFPHLAGTSGLPSLAELNSADPSSPAPASLSLSSATRLTRQTARSLVFLTLSPLALTRQEIAHRREGIRRARDALAVRIGELTLAATGTSSVADKLRGGDDSDAEDAREELRRAPGLAQLFSPSAGPANAGTGAGGDDAAAPLSLDDVRQATWQTLVHLDAVLTPARSAPTLEASSSAPSTPADLAHALSFLLRRTLPSHTHLHAQTAGALAPPAALTRAWPFVLSLPLAAALVGRALYARRDALAQYAREAAEAARGFVLDWVVEPVRGIVDTLRGGEAGVALLGRESLRSDLDSLERMVVDFARDEYALSADELAVLGDRVRAGDLTAVLKAWEKDIKTPVRSAVSGSLIRTLLIQVQKVKVDVALAMDGIEKMLKSQQLTFGFVGVAPSMLVLAVLGRWIRGLTRSDGGRKRRGEVHRRCWMTVRQLDLLLSPPRSARRASTASALSSAQHTHSPTAALTQGNLLLSLASLRAYAHSRLFPRRDTQLRAAFLADVRAVEREGATAGKRERRVLLARLERWAKALAWEEGVRA
ncbi:Nuclear control of ATPase protein 2 [Rhodotorula kratochvilovae]